MRDSHAVPLVAGGSSQIVMFNLLFISSARYSLVGLNVTENAMNSNLSLVVITRVFLSSYIHPYTLFLFKRVNTKKQREKKKVKHTRVCPETCANL